MATHVPDTVLVGVARTSEREHSFKWAGPFLSARFVLMSLRERHLNIHDDNYLKPLNIGTVRQDVLNGMVKKVFPNARRAPVATLELNMRKLLNGRVDAVAHVEPALHMFIKRHGLSPDLFETVHVFCSKPVYFAFNPNISDAYVERFNAALQRLKVTGAYSEIWGRYAEDAPPFTPATAPDSDACIAITEE